MPIVTIRPMRLPGRWREGYALDYHTIRSEFVGHDEFGHSHFNTERSDIGELLYRLKYRSDHSVMADLVETAAGFLQSQPWSSRIDGLVPVPPSRERAVQPIVLLAEGVARRLGLLFAPDWVRKAGRTSELKDIYDYEERLQALSGAHEVDREKVEGRCVLLFDDLYRSGATMNAITKLLYDQGGAADVFAVTMTRTRIYR